MVENKRRRSWENKRRRRGEELGRMRGRGGVGDERRRRAGVRGG